jgi:tRNA dimethylallyltransferase
MPSDRLVVAVVGPTAAGKSALGVALAHRLGGEVVNADSMQLYRGMDVGTAKLSEAERAGIAHHVLDIWDVTETASVADYQARARASVAALLADGVTPVIVGGSGLYVRALLDPIEFPGTDAAVRQRLEAELAGSGAAALHARLARRDPAAAAAILPSNGRRIVRALEVIELTGRPFTAALPAYRSVYDGDGVRTVQIGLDLPTGLLDERIDRRAAAMFAGGLIEEVRRLDAARLRTGVTASRALGYAQVLAVFDGRITVREAVEETARGTRRLVRRQRSWFRRDPRVRWLDPTDQSLDAALALIRSAPTS